MPSSKNRRGNNLLDQGRIALRYREVSKESGRRAHVLGLKDYEDSASIRNHQQLQTMTKANTAPGANNERLVVCWRKPAAGVSRQESMAIDTSCSSSYHSDPSSIVTRRYTRPRSRSFEELVRNQGLRPC
jgi:hypothetical protein